MGVSCALAMARRYIAGRTATRTTTTGYESPSTGRASLRRH
jgi:hypothetical protein